MICTFDRFSGFHDSAVFSVIVILSFTNELFLSRAAVFVLSNFSLIFIRN
jgi:hypothetical protein